MLEVSNRNEDQEGQMGLTRVLSAASSLSTSAEESALALVPQESYESLIGSIGSLEPQDSKVEEELETCVEEESESDVEAKWSALLQSPAEPCFSPSLPISKSLHGLALTVVVERAKSLTKCGKRCATLLHAGET